MKVLLDTNVVLDHLLAREPHVGAAEQVLSLVDSGRLDGLICSTTVTTIHYLASKAVGPSAAVEHVRKLLMMFDVAGVDRDVLRNALDAGFTDFEDAVLYEAARKAGAGAIVTRDAKGFAPSDLPVFSPIELLAALGAEG
ncbi:MAG: PIN domain-containing protein [Armatimonadetes bacterium]|nr:PIN domain-containing protein [Armatimonadota bacterium]